MPRGKPAKDGDEYTSANGYRYLRVHGKWRLKHHVIAENVLGRPIKETEFVKFKDRDRTNLDPSNIEVLPKRTTSTRTRLAQIDARIAELQAEKAALEAQLPRV